MVICHAKGLRIKVCFFFPCIFTLFRSQHLAVIVYLSILFSYLDTQTQVCLFKLGSVFVRRCLQWFIQFCTERDTIASARMESEVATAHVHLAGNILFSLEVNWCHHEEAQTDKFSSKTLFNVCSKQCVCVLLLHAHTDTSELKGLGQETALYKNCQVKYQNVFAGGTDSVMRGSFISPLKCEITTLITRKGSFHCFRAG